MILLKVLSASEQSVWRNEPIVPPSWLLFLLLLLLSPLFLEVARLARLLIIVVALDTVVKILMLLPLLFLEEEVVVHLVVSIVTTHAKQRLFTKTEDSQTAKKEKVKLSILTRENIKSAEKKDMEDLSSACQKALYSPIKYYPPFDTYFRCCGILIVRETGHHSGQIIA